MTKKLSASDVVRALSFCKRQPESARRSAHPGLNMSPTSVESPPGATPTNGHPANGSSTTEKPTFLRSAISTGDVSSVKTNGMDRIWRSVIQVAEEKVTGEDGQKVVVAAW